MYNVLSQFILDNFQKQALNKKRTYIDNMSMTKTEFCKDSSYFQLDKLCE